MDQRTMQLAAMLLGEPPKRQQSSASNNYIAGLDLFKQPFRPIPGRDGIVRKLGLHDAPYVPGFVQPGMDFNNAMPPLAANSPQQPMAMSQQTVTAPVAPPPGLLPAMQPGTQIGDNAAYSGVRANWRPEDQAALQAILDQQKQAASQQASAVPSWWANPWQAP